MPDANGNFKGILVPELPWQKDKPAPGLSELNLGSIPKRPERKTGWHMLVEGKDKRPSTSEA